MVALTREERIVQVQRWSIPSTPTRGRKQVLEAERYLKFKTPVREALFGL